MKTPVGQQTPATCQGRSKNGSVEAGVCPRRSAVARGCPARRRSGAASVSTAKGWRRSRGSSGAACAPRGPVAFAPARASSRDRPRRERPCGLVRGPSGRDDARAPGGQGFGVARRLRNPGVKPPQVERRRIISPRTCWWRCCTSRRRRSRRRSCRQCRCSSRCRRSSVAWPSCTCRRRSSRS